MRGTPSLTDDREPTSGQARRLDRFLQRLAGLLAEHLFTFAANRARQKREFGKAYAAWADLLDEAVALSDHMTTALPSVCPPRLLVQPVQFLLLASMEQAMGAGLELELYDEDELPCMYWLLSEIQGEQEALLDTVSPGTPWLTCFRHAARAMRHLGLAQCLVRLPLPHLDLNRVHHAMTRRIKWLRRPAWCTRARLHMVTQPDSHASEPLWEQWQAFQQGVHATPEMRTRVLQHISACHTHVTAHNRAAPSDTWLSLCHTTYAAHMKGVQTSCEALGELVRAAPAAASVAWRASSHPWYAIPTWS